MTDSIKTEAQVPVDLFNPGQVFACLGLLEAAEVLCGDAEGYFDWSDSLQVRFHLRASGDESPVLRVLRFLDQAEAHAELVEGSPNIEKWSWDPKPTVLPATQGYPFPDPSSPATVVCALVVGSDRLAIEHWGDKSGRDNVKFWAGAGGYPGVALAADALNLVRGRAAQNSEDPFSVSARQSSSFRLDWRRDYIPIDIGFSLNNHSGRIQAVGYPLVELLGALGLSHARPRRPNPRFKFMYLYGIIGRASATPDIWLPAPFHRVALGASVLPFPCRRFRMSLDSPGKDDRAITTVTEESTS
jgi:CRISPR-associated protein Csb3